MWWERAGGKREGKKGALSLSLSLSLSLCAFRFVWVRRGEREETVWCDVMGWDGRGRDERRGMYGGGCSMLCVTNQQLVPVSRRSRAVFLSIK
jgi:hypothetical protein